VWAVLSTWPLAGGEGQHRAEMWPAAWSHQDSTGGRVLGEVAAHVHSGRDCVVPDRWAGDELTEVSRDATFDLAQGQIRFVHSWRISLDRSRSVVRSVSWNRR
jgi:hypothetical protein